VVDLEPRMGRIRSFIALALPKGVKDGIAAWQRAELSDALASALGGRE